MTFPARYFLIGLVALAAAGLIGWHFFGARGEVLKPDDGPVVTVMDFGRRFPLDPLPSGWQRRKFWTRSPMTMSFAVKDGAPSMRFETHDSASMLFRHGDIDLVAYPMLAWRWYIELPIRSPLDERTREGDDHPARLFLRFATDRGEKRAMEVIGGNRLKPGDYKYIGGFPHFVADAGDDRVGRWLDERIALRRRFTWSISRCSATAMTRTLPASATSLMLGLNGGGATDQLFALQMSHRMEALQLIASHFERVIGFSRSARRVPRGTFARPR
jgi:hypothetical protein